MGPNDLRELLRQRPFGSFRIYLSDGAVYNIRHPDQAAVGRLTVALAMAASSDPQSLTDPVVLISLLHITRLEPILSTERTNPG